MPSPSDNLRTWIEIDTKALRSNIGAFRRLIGAKTLLMAVVKSNAYGHGLEEFARAGQAIKLADRRPGIDWFGVDTFAEARRLRKAGIRKPILVLGYTLPAYFREAGRRNISLTLSTFENIKALKRLRPQPKIHIKIDTGLHRQGFLPEEIHRVINELKRAGIIKEVEGVYTHLAAAKDKTNSFFNRYTLAQLGKFEKAYLDFEAHGFLPFLRHAAATAATIWYPQSRYDLVRIGIGLYGLWPSMGTRQTANRESPIAGIKLKPILVWKTLVSEIKSIPAGSYIGYDLTERTIGNTRLAILPVGYWHGFSRRLSGSGEVLIRGRRCRVLGLVSMDMTAVDVTNIPGVRIGDQAVIIGRQGKEEVSAYELAKKIGTSHYEVVTRINPLIKRIYKE